MTAGETGVLPLGWFLAIAGGCWFAAGLVWLFADGGQRIDEAMAELSTDEPEPCATEPVGVVVVSCDCTGCRRAVWIARQMLAARARQMLADRVHIDMDSPEVEAELAELLRGGLR